ncbi:Potassium-transporting ATPase KdpC subunit [Paenibacillus sp. CECT 9249]|uniref:potassium-transporting ATPase subunit KdpC n=1 Tax=Paenibacillus sp. CECT 9249 TaxID=2845385 RepID=UPI001E43A1E8|nr:potassium-transporting ATPase subunit KdpC [Paenibacillus sp. CECT 9249]CAH0120809.1 Potassium-transporting ATPase KdpC subunit [Paenibacillus sp. CECT 9249]
MKLLASSLRISLLFMVLCGLGYNLAVTGIAQIIFPEQADGSLVQDDDGTVIGSKLIGQLFSEPEYFHGRVSSIDYQADGSGSPNYAPSHPELMERVTASVEEWKMNNPEVPVSDVPMDLLTNSASGLDPDISPEAARAQIPRISRLTGIEQKQLESLVQEQTTERALGFLGEPAVNVLQLNIGLQRLLAR